MFSPTFEATVLSPRALEHAITKGILCPGFVARAEIHPRKFLIIFEMDVSYMLHRLQDPDKCKGTEEVIFAAPIRRRKTFGIGTYSPIPYKLEPNFIIIEEFRIASYTYPQPTKNYSPTRDRNWIDAFRDFMMDAIDELPKAYIDDHGVWRLGDWSWEIPKKEV